MASDKRKFVEFNGFPGEVKDNVYLFKALYYTDSHENKRKWQVMARLVKPEEQAQKHKYGWEVNNKFKLDLQDSYLLDDLDKSNIPDGSLGQLWVESGVIDGKLSRYTPSYPKSKNEGKKNFRHSLKQALILGRSKYLKKYEEGGRPIEEYVDNMKPNTDHKLKTSTWENEEADTKFFPMLARKYEDEKNKVVFPVCVQPKLDGVRCLAQLDRGAGELEVSLYSRHRKIFEGMDHIKAELMLLLKDMYGLFKQEESVRLDGEFYRHGRALQDITGEVRNVVKNNKISDNGLQLHLFDLFYPSKSNMQFNERHELLTGMFEKFPNLKYIVKVETTVAKTDKKIQTIKNAYLRKKYEGVIVRLPTSPYSTHPTKTSTALRSRGVLKIKPRFSDEFKIVGFTEGTKGRDVGAILWICETKDKVQFNVTPKDTTYPKRYALFKKVKANPSDYIGKDMTVEYEDLSKNKVPLRAKATSIRDYE
jgi:hypothetical protein